MLLALYQLIVLSGQLWYDVGVALKTELMCGMVRGAFSGVGSIMTAEIHIWLLSIGVHSEVGLMLHRATVLLSIISVVS